MVRSKLPDMAKRSRLIYRIIILSAAFCKLTNVQPTELAADQIVRKFALGRSLADEQLQFAETPMHFKAVVLICSMWFTMASVIKNLMPAGHMRRDARYVHTRFNQQQD